MKRSLVALSVLALAFVVVLRSQNTAVVKGTISDPAGAAVAYAAIDLKPAEGSAVRTTSDQTGQYEFKGLAGGDYELTASVPGFRKYTAKIQLEAGQILKHDIRVEVGSVSESVTVSSQPAPVSRLVKNGPSRDYEAHPMPARGIRRPSAPPNTEQYDYWVENEFCSTKKDPLSTFSVDVDTASYANVRRFLMERQMPPPGAVRIEELLNYFTYDYPSPEEGKPISVTTQLSSSPWNAGRQVLLVGVKTKPIAWDKLPPSRLTFLIDVSGSMESPERLPLVQQSLRLLVRQLRPQDSVAMVVYAGAAGVVLAPTAGDQQDRIMDAIERLRAGGSTHGSAGIRKAYELARESFAKDGNNRVILATDGDFNVGVTSDDELIRVIEKERQTGVFLTVLAFGIGNLKDAKMEKLADHGNGNYAYIDTLSEARKALVQQMGATLVTVAKDVKLQIEFNPARVKSWRLIGYENRVLRAEDFNDDTRDAGDLGAGHQVTALYELIPEGSAEGAPEVDPLRYQQEPKNAKKSRGDELAWLKLRHKLPQSDKSQLTEWPVPARAVPFEETSADFRFATAVAEYGMLLRQSKFAGKASFEHAAHVARQATSPEGSSYRIEFIELVDRARELYRR